MDVIQYTFNFCLNEIMIAKLACNLGQQGYWLIYLYYLYLDGFINQFGPVVGCWDDHSKPTKLFLLCSYTNLKIDPIIENQETIE